MLAIPIMGSTSYFNWEWPSTEEWWILLFIGIASVFGQIFMAVALLAEDASKIIPLKYVGAIFALIVGYYFFNEGIPLLSLAGIVLIISVMIVNSRLNIRR